MDTIRRWTTPTQEFTIEGVDLTSSDVYVTFSQDDTITTFSGDDITVTYDDEDTTITVPLDQTTTGAFDEGSIAVQVNWITDGERNATSIEYFKIAKNLYDEEIS